MRSAELGVASSVITGHTRKLLGARVVLSVYMEAQRQRAKLAINDGVADQLVVLTLRIGIPFPTHEATASTVRFLLCRACGACGAAPASATAPAVAPVGVPPDAAERSSRSCLR